MEFVLGCSMVSIKQTNPVLTPEGTNFLPLIAECQTSYDVFRLLRSICVQYDFSHFSSINIPRDAQENLSELSVVSNWPPELVNAYDALGLLKKSPIIARLKSSVEPIVWELEALNADRSDNNQANAAVELFRDFGFEMGVYFSVHTAAGELGAVSFSGKREAPSIDELVTLNFLSQTIFAKLKQFEIKKTSSDMALSPREEECLIWTAAGKTSAEISTILDISEHTINHYLGSICQKLNAQNRAHAVSKAMRMGLLK
jgi:DNA-binding CsgD family transcriptional regulator